MERVARADTRPRQANRLEQITKFVNTRVFELVTLANKDGKEAVHYQEVLTTGDMKMCVDLNTNNLREYQLRCVLGHFIRLMYGLKDKVAVAVAKETIADSFRKFGVNKPSALKVTRPQDISLESAFTQTEYLGTASFEFRGYVERCCDVYGKNQHSFEAPYVLVAQSSGFGKSRMVFELARMMKSSSKMKVLYVCARTYKSTGYPRTTDNLRDWLFPRNCTEAMIVTRLKVIFQYAVENWETVQDEWLNLFTSTDADISVTKSFVQKTPSDEKTADKKTSPTDEISSRVVIVVIDGARALLEKQKNGLNNFCLLQRALRTVFPTVKVFGVLVDTHPNINNRTLTFSSDQRRMFPPFVLTHMMDVFWKKYCDEQAIWSEETDEMEVNMEGEVVEAADEMMDDQISDLEELKEDDVADKKCKAFDGIKEKCVTENPYRDVVLGSNEVAWNALVRMGRPLWYSTSPTSTIFSQRDVIELAARKLLVQLIPSAESYTMENMFGVASLLCRVGLRPFSSTSFAPRFVTDLMAVLAYVNYEQVAYLISYASDPVLNLGAIRVWYGERGALSEFILPELKRLIRIEALDTGKIDKVVARIVLLLAMDKWVMEDIGINCYVGQFMNVHAFLKVLGVNEMPVFTPQMREAPDTTKDAFRTWLSNWDGWQMGFTHFVQLKKEPTEETLWLLLGRRAAGIFPRNQTEASLLIPIFWKKTDDEAAFDSEMKSEDAVDVKVSLMLIQVENRSSQYSDFPESVTELRPSNLFGDEHKKPEATADPPFEISAKGSNEESVERQSATNLVENPLSKKSVRDVICIYMNMHEEDCDYHRFIYAKELDDKNDDCSGAKSVDETMKSKSMKAPLSVGRTRANLGESEAHGSKCRRFSVGGSKAASAATASGPNDSTKAPSELMFTLCYRSVHSDTYKFLDAEVAERLVETLSPPRGRKYMSDAAF